MRIVIVGPGAIGCLLAAYLAKSKEEVFLLDHQPERASKINQQGIIVEGVSGNWQARVSVFYEAKEIGKADLVIICVKSYATKEAVASSLSLLDKDTLFLTLQNGLGNVELIAEQTGQERVIAGVTNQGATLLGPGHIRHAGRGETILGRLDGKIPVQLRSIREVFNRAGLETKVSRDIKGLLWSKLIINVGINALSAITRLRNGQLIKYEATHQILKEAVNEAVKIAKKKRIKLIYDDPLAKVESVCEATADNISSMLQDVLNKKKTEIDFINGVIVRQAQGLGVAVTVNSTLLNLVKAIEQTYTVAL